MTIMVHKIARFPRVFLEDWVPLIVKSHYQTSSSCNEAFISLPEALAKFQLPLLNMFLNLESYHLLTFLMKLSVSEKSQLISSDGLLYGELVCVTKMPNY